MPFFLTETKRSEHALIALVQEVFVNGISMGKAEKVIKNIESRKISSTNSVEKLNRKIRRRGRVAGIVPSQETNMGLITTDLIEDREE